MYNVYYNTAKICKVFHINVKYEHNESFTTKSKLTSIILWKSFIQL